MRKLIEHLESELLESVKIKIAKTVVDDDATSNLRKIKKLRAKNSGDINSAMISAAYYAKKNGYTMYVYMGNSYMWAVWNVTRKLSDALTPINNMGKQMMSVEPDLTVKVHDLQRPSTKELKQNAAAT